MKIIGIIPARYKSSRFEGKPLAKILDKPMIWWVYNQAKKVKLLDDVIVATEDQRIFDVCQTLSIKVMMTSDEHQTGTDRIGEIARKIPADLYINIQGDEPMIEPQTIEKAILPFLVDPNLQLTNLMKQIKDPIELINPTVPKVIVNKDNIGVFLTRSASPYPKGKTEYKHYKQVCVYGFKPEMLAFFCSSQRGLVESIEDIEILRFIENGYKIQFIEVDSETVAVDTPNDLKVVNRLMREKNILQENGNA